MDGDKFKIYSNDEYRLNISKLNIFNWANYMRNVRNFIMNKS